MRPTYHLAIFFGASSRLDFVTRESMQSLQCNYGWHPGKFRGRDIDVIRDVASDMTYRRLSDADKPPQSVLCFILLSLDYTADHAD